MTTKEDQAGAKKEGAAGESQPDYMEERFKKLRKSQEENVKKAREDAKK